MNPLRPIAVVFLTIAALAIAAPVLSASQLDQKHLHSDYNEGNFEKVVAALEGFMATHKTYNFEDSVFIAKHLAVVYTANPDTREKGKYYISSIRAKKRSPTGSLKCRRTD